MGTANELWTIPLSIICRKKMWISVARFVHYSKKCQQLKKKKNLKIKKNKPQKHSTHMCFWKSHAKFNEFWPASFSATVYTDRQTNKHR